MKSIGIIGLGITGCAMVRHCLTHKPNCSIVGIDNHPQPSALTWLQQQNIKLFLGPQAFQEAQNSEALSEIWCSPGVNMHAPFMQPWWQAAIPIAGEFELMHRYLTMPTIAVTGTNGKSTVVSLLGHLLQQCIPHMFIGGNLGTPVSEISMLPTPPHLAIIEVSSYQLEGTWSWRPQIGILLNIKPDHFERYQGMSRYIEAKARLLSLVPPTGTIILNADCPITANLARYTHSQIRWISSAQSLPEPWEKLSSIPLNSHHRLNLLACLSAIETLSLADPPTTLIKQYQSFKPLPHRLEKVKTIQGITYINDSKATNPHATASAIDTLTAPCVLLVGGQDKQTGFAELQHALNEHQHRIRAIICFGEAKELIFQSLMHPHKEYAHDLNQAVHLATKHAQPGDIVLLSPACASFDAYRSYHERGEHFQQLVHNLANRVLL